MKPSIDAGKLRDALQVLELKESTAGTWTWQRTGKARGQVELTTGRNLFSSVGIGARGAEIILRRRALTLHQALLWGEQHLFLTAILPEGRLHLRVQAALVEVETCVTTPNKISFPAVRTEKYARFERSDPYDENEILHVLVTPKRIQLELGELVEVGGQVWAVRSAHELDPHKNEYEIARRVEH